MLGINSDTLRGWVKQAQIDSRRRAGVHVPVKKPARGELDVETKTRNALLRYQGERGFALMS